MKKIMFDLKCIFLFSAMASVAACSSVPKKQTEEWPVRIIDAHTHTGFDGLPERSSGIIYSKAEYFNELDASHVVGAVVMGGREGSADEPTDHHVVHCAGVGIPVDYKRVRTGLKSKKYSCIKIYLGYVHAYPSDKAYQPLYKMAEEFDVPVVFHTGDTYSIKGKLKYSDPLTVDEVAVDYPKVTFVIAHVGNPWIQSAAEVAYKNPNVYLDGSALLIGKLSDYSKEDLEKYVIEPLHWVLGYVESSKKLMFGTDWPLVNMHDYISVFKKAIPYEQWDQVFYKNARRVFKMNELPE